MAIYRGSGGAGDAVADAASEASLIRTLAVEVQADADAAEAARVAAVAAKVAAETAETNAETAETNAETAETNAETAASAASSSASSASTSATNAASSASSASTSATNAASSASAANSSASSASTSATNAASSASSASTSATNASNSATAAASSASAASASETAAASSASSASTSATNAASSASNASTSASTATTQAGIATTQATNAASSATAAAGSASSASTSATNAASSATSASNSASAASTSATNASNSASAASTSATNAANSASAAATSATNAANSATLAASYTPSQTGNAGKFLTTDGTNTSWGTVSGSISVTGGDLTLSGATGTAITNATLATVNSNVGSFGSSSAIPVVTVNAKGLVTGVTTATVAGGFGFKNRIINGAMMIDQRNAGASVTNVASAYTYALDRWSYFSTQASKFTIQQNAGSVTPPAGFSNYLGITSSSAYSIVSGDLIGLRQAIEGFNVSDLAWGTANASPVTLSFKVYSSLTGTFGGSVQNNAQNRSYPFTYTISSANTWTTISITIAGDTTGTWLTTNGLGIAVWFNLGSGATYSGTAGSWAGANYVGATGQTSVVGTNGATFYITGVQLEKGSTATSFDYRPYGTELALCQRYAVMYKPNVTDSSIAIGSWRSSTATFNYLPYPVEMRTTPSLSVSSASDWGSSTEGFHGGSVIASTSITIATESNNKSAYISASNAGSGTAYRPNGLQSMNTSASLLLSAEL